METIEKKIQISINGSVHVQGPRADYFKFLKGFCALIAGDLDEFDDKKTQYLIAQVLFENIKFNAMVNPNGRRSSLQCNVHAENFTEHPYMMKRFRMENHKSNTLVYFVDDCTVLKLSYNLTLNIKESDKNRSNLLTQNWKPFIIQIDDDIIKYIKMANEEFKKNKPFDLTQLSRFMAENMVKTLGKNKLYNAPPILPKLYAALEGNENKNIELNNVE